MDLGDVLSADAGALIGGRDAVIELRGDTD